MLRMVSVLLLLGQAPAAKAEVILACTFPTLPPVVMRFPDQLDAEKTMEVGARPPVELIEGQGSGRLITASVDGYDFRFAPANSVLDVEQGGKLMISETGQCVTMGGPTNKTPLVLAAPATEATTVAPEVAKNEVSVGKWLVSEDRSSFDDSATVAVSLGSSEDVRGQFGAPGPAKIYLRCMENTTSVYLLVNDLFLSDIQGFGQVQYRIDEQPSAKVRMNSSTDNKALGLWDGGTAIPMIKKLLEGKGIVFRVTPFNESPIEFSFDLSGIANAVAPLRKACSW